MTEMHHFAIYEEATGRVLRTGRGTNPRIIESQVLGDGEALFAGEIDPSREFLPGGFPAPKPEEPSTVTPSEVKAWAGRLLSYTDFYVTRHAETAQEIPEGVTEYRQAVRDRSGEIEAMEPIPADYRDPKYWPTRP